MKSSSCSNKPNFKALCRSFAFLLLSLAVLPAAANDAWDFAAPHKNRCADDGQQAMNACLAAEYEKVDARLNQTYQKLVTQLQDATALKKAQAAWLRFRALECRYANSGLGKDGSLYLILPTKSRQ